MCDGIVLSPLINYCSPKEYFSICISGPWKYIERPTHSTPFLNIVSNGTDLRGSYDMFGMLPSFEVLGHHTGIDSPIMSKNALSIVLLLSLYY